MAEIALRGVRKSYGKNAVVHGVDLDIRSGEFIVFLGPSGCGKSTLLRMIAGLEEISEGEIAIAGRVVNKLEPSERGCAMVFQNYALYPHMTVAENIGYALKVAGVSKAERARRIAEVAKSLNLELFLDRRPAALSGGQRQRVAMGRAIIREPVAFLFDEPLSNLDAKLRVSMRGEIKQLQKRLGTTSVYVTHDQTEAMTLGDRLVVLNKGLVEQIGSPLEVYHKPASTFVAGFIGSPAMNLVDAENSDGGIRIGDHTINAGPNAPRDAKLVVGFRAEDATASLEIEGRIPLQLAYVEELGAQRLLHGTISGQQIIVAAPSTQPFADRMGLTIATDHFHYFSATDGKRIAGSPIPAADIAAAEAQVQVQVQV